jgi:solute carrier family 25 protein 34/35
MIRTGFGSSVQLPTYFLAKRRLVRHLGMEDGPALHLASSAVSGFVVCVVMHPPGKSFHSPRSVSTRLTGSADTIMSRLYNQNGNLYNGVLDCLTKTVRTEGFFAIYKGFFPHLARILPHTVLTLSLAEQTNKLIRKLENHILPSPALNSA